MATDPLLRNAVKAIKEKIIAGAATATPEELAYLGTAIDRIGGRATVLEVEEMGDIKIEEITEHADHVKSAAIASINSTKDAAIAAVNTASNAAKDAMLADIAAAANSVTQQFVFGARAYFYAQL